MAGRQAPLGHRGSEPAELRTETSANYAGDGVMRQQVIGAVDEERVEGLDDVLDRRSAPRGPAGRSTRRRNVHVGSDVSARFHNLSEGFQAINRLTRAISTNLVPPPPPPPQPVELVRQYHEITGFLENATTDGARRFYQQALNRVAMELENQSPQQDAPAQQDDESEHGASVN